MAPIIAALVNAGLRLVANAALVKGKEFIEEKTGVNLDKDTLTPDDNQKLLQFQLEHEEELLKLQLENNKLSLEETKAYLEDIQDARKVHASVLTSEYAPWYAKAIQPALAALVVLGSITLFTLFVLWSGDRYVFDTAGKYVIDPSTGKPLVLNALNSTQRDIIIYILGVLSAAVTQILGYYFGSSQGSASKSATIQQVLDKKPS